MVGALGSRWAGGGDTLVGPQLPFASSSRSTTSFSLSLSLPAFLPLHPPEDPSPRRGASRPAEHQENRLSEF